MHPELTIPLLGTYSAYRTILVLVGVIGAGTAATAVARATGAPVARAAWAVLVLAAAAVLGARIHYAIAHPGTLAGLGTALRQLAGGGLHTGGGLVGCVAALPAAARLVGVPPAALADALAPTTAGLFGGIRIACLLHGCCFGRACAWPWCFGYPQGSPPFQELVATGALPAHATATGPLQPLPLYFLASGLAIAALAAWHRPRQRFAGETALLTASALAVTLAALEPFRADLPTRVYWGPLPQLVWTALAMTALSLGALLRAERRHAAGRRS